MKKFLIMALMLTMVYSVSAQVNFGPRVALTSTKISLKDNATAIKEGDGEFGYQFGAFLRVKVPVVGIYVQPELLFSNSSATLNNGTDDVDFSFNRIDVPVMVGGKIGPLRINAGPAFRFLTSAESDLAGVTTDVKNNYKDSTVGYQAGLGIDLLKFVFDLKYEGSLDSFAEEGQGFNVDQRMNQWVFAVGFKLF
ncbi:outer membrane beta-barrel protein [Roseivirga seohaensis]|uniref:outer membrane beta-barrel protein n=1 Tax=Roseivirga seohaensis TaxID=1914963 RepID=UPI0009EA968B|nr:outer membrane beta-barrel protein [Roseivirga seohaensis]